MIPLAALFPLHKVIQDRKVSIHKLTVIISILPETNMILRTLLFRADFWKHRKKAYALHLCKSMYLSHRQAH